MQVFFISIVAAGILAISLYLYFFSKRLFAFFSKTQPKWFRVVFALATLAMLVAAFVNPLGTATVVFGYFAVFCLLFDAIGLVYRKWFLQNKFIKHLYSGGLPAVFLTAAVVAFGVWNGYNVVMTTYDVPIEKDFTGDALTIAFLADTHVGVTITAENIEEYCHEIESQNPDIVLLGGDLFDERTTAEEIEIASRALGSIASTYGTYFVWGNHEGDAHVVSGGEPTDVAFIHETLEKNGIVLLEDDTVLIDDRFYLVGRLDASLGANMVSAESLLTGLDATKPIVVLEHSPIDFEQMAQLGADLYLCGHTHGGQMPPLGFFESFLYDGIYGEEKQDDCTMIITSGMGTWNTPIRLGSVSEYVIIHLT